jgi:hypothetical protein
MARVNDEKTGISTIDRTRNGLVATKIITGSEQLT